MCPPGISADTRLAPALVMGPSVKTPCRGDAALFEPSLQCSGGRGLDVFSSVSLLLSRYIGMLDFIERTLISLGLLQGGKGRIGVVISSYMHFTNVSAR